MAFSKKNPPPVKGGGKKYPKNGNYSKNSME